MLLRDSGGFPGGQTVKNPPVVFPWRREWLPTPVFLPGDFHGQRSWEGYNPWGLKKLDMTKQLTLKEIPE